MSDDIEQAEAIPPIGFIAYETDAEGQPKFGIFHRDHEGVTTHYTHQWLPVVAAESLSTTYTMLAMLLAHIHGEGHDRMRHVGLQTSYDRAVNKVLAWRATNPDPVPLREVEFSDGFVHRWKDGRLEYRSLSKGWIECHEIRMADFDKVFDLRRNPHVTVPL